MSARTKQLYSVLYNMFRCKIFWPYAIFGRFFNGENTTEFKEFTEFAIFCMDATVDSYLSRGTLGTVLTFEIKGLKLYAHELELSYLFETGH